MVRLPPPLRPLFPYLKPAYTATTRAVAPATIALSRRRAQEDGLPTGWVATLDDAAESTGGRVCEVRPAEVVTREPLPGGPLDDVFAAEQTETIPRGVVAELPGGRVLGPHRAVISRRNDLVQDVSYYFGTSRPREHPIFLTPGLPPVTDVGGRLGVLATRGDVNYYHFLMDVLPRLAVQEAAGADIAAPDRWYVPAGVPFQRELLELAKVDVQRCLDATQYPHVRAETLVVPSPPSMTVVNPPWVVSHLRRTLLPDDVGRVPGRGLYVTRGASNNNRAVTNEDEVVAMVTELGFDAVDFGSVSVAEQIRLFGQASVIVAAHGAALANLVFASAGATVIELFPAGAAVPDYWKLAYGVPGLTYRYLMGLGNARRRSRSQMLVSDVTVDVTALRETIAQAFRTERPG